VAGRGMAGHSTYLKNNNMKYFINPSIFLVVGVLAVLADMIL
jgi:hypothetical protein